VSVPPPPGYIELNEGTTKLNEGTTKSYLKVNRNRNRIHDIKLRKDKRRASLLEQFVADQVLLFDCDQFDSEIQLGLDQMCRDKKQKAEQMFIHVQQAKDECIDLQKKHKDDEHFKEINKRIFELMESYMDGLGIMNQYFPNRTETSDTNTYILDIESKPIYLQLNHYLKKQNNNEKIPCEFIKHVQMQMERLTENMRDFIDVMYTYNKICEE